MAFDGGFLYKIAEELNEAIDCHIDKIYQPSKDELVFLLRKKGFVKRLLITVKSGSARIHFTENKFENPATPPNFCMLLRKYISSAKLLKVYKPDLERVIFLKFSASNEMGDIIELTLVCEFIGNQANVILVNEKNVIIDSLRHSDVENAVRYILPGAKYFLPPKQEKLNPLLSPVPDLKGENLSKQLLNTVDGFSPLICREIEYLSSKTDFKSAFNKILNNLKSAVKPVLLLNPDKKPFDFSYTEINQYGKDYVNQIFPTFSALLDEFYSAKDLAAKISANAHDITKLINNSIARSQKKLALRLNELENCKDRETLRIYGELIKANLHSIKQGSQVASVINYYDENAATINIPLNPALSPAKNADKYFKDYKKSYTAEQTLTKLIAETKEELIYFDTVLDSIKRASSLSEIAEIREELTQSGLIKKKTVKQKKTAAISLKEETSVEGFRIIIGKNNTQNDYITTRLAGKNDLWFHTKNIAGSHVIVMCDGKSLSDETILKAATLAAKNSSAANSSNVPVDYTPIKFVKKPSGAKPGMVIYTTNKTVYVTPKEDI